MTIVCIGDSLTYGYGLTEGLPWVRVLAEKTGIEVINQGIPGNMTEEMSRRFSRDVLENGAEWVIMLGGTNDIFLQGAKAAPFRHLTEMAGRAKARGLRVLMLTPLPVYEEIPAKTWFMECDYGQVNRDLRKLGFQLVEWCQRQEIPVVDLWGILAERTDKDRCFLSDGIHVNAKIHRAIGERIYEWFDRQGIQLKK